MREDPEQNGGLVGFIVARFLPPSMPEDRATRPTVLVVGDSEWTTTAEATLAREAEVSVASRVDAPAEFDAVSPDCVVTAAATESDARSVIETIREADSAVPVVLWDDTHDPRLASDAVAVGVAEYVVEEDDLADAVARAVGGEVERPLLRRRARQFDALFSDPETCMWVLEPDGTLVRANERARDLLDEGLIGLLLVVGVVLFLIPEPATSGLGILLVVAGVVLWILDWLA